MTVFDSLSLGDHDQGRSIIQFDILFQDLVAENKMDKLFCMDYEYSVLVFSKQVDNPSTITIVST